MKESLDRWAPAEGALQATTNTRYDSKGEVTITIPFEYALVILGALGKMPVRKNMVNGDSIVMSNLYDQLLFTMEKIEPTLKQSPHFRFGQDIVKPGSATAEARPLYMKGKF